jgi:two-component system chemotaxis sensor kinase CheA
VDQNRRELLIELEDAVEQIFLDLDALRGALDDNRVRRQLIDRIFRRVHSIKGSAASFGLDSVSLVAHEFETLLAALRDGSVDIDSDVLDLCETTTEAISESLSFAAAGTPEPPREDLFKELAAAAAGNADRSQDNRFLSSVPEEVRQSLTESEQRRFANLIAEGNAAFIVRSAFEPEAFAAGFPQLQQRLAGCGEVISTSPAVDPESQKVSFVLLYASTLTSEALHRELAAVCNAQVECLATDASAESVASSADRAQLPSYVASRSTFVRVEVDRLDRLISETHDLFKTTTNALDSRTAEALPSELSDAVRRSFLTLEEELINLRMVTLGPTLQRAMRAGRSAARASSKSIQFHVTGAEARIDKIVADAIADPLVHLVRIAVDLGIEGSAVRERSGKSAGGTILIAAVKEGSQTIIRVTDDGQGIDPVQVSDAARRLGIVEPDARLDFERSLRLIFRPGFTTVTTVSDVSGRGVGLDVVENGVEQVGGELRVSSKSGEGTTFEIRLPVTFGLLTAMVVVAGGIRYCIASDDLIEQGQQRGADDNLPIVSLQELLGSPTQVKGEATQQLLTCRLPNEYASSNNGFKRLRLAVDEVEGREEVLVRNLGRHAGRWYGIAGATELRDGTVALVLDLPRLLTWQSPHN